MVAPRPARDPFPTGASFLGYPLPKKRTNGARAGDAKSERAAATQMRLLVWHGPGDPPPDAGGKGTDDEPAYVMKERVTARFRTVTDAVNALPEGAPAIVILDGEKCARDDLDTLVSSLAGGPGILKTVQPPLTAPAAARLLVAADYLACDDLVSTYASAYAQTLRSKSVQDIVAAGAHAELGMDLVRLIFTCIPVPAASMLCEAWASSTVCHGLLTPESARVLGTELAVAAPADLVAFPPLRSPVRARRAEPTL